MREVKFRGKDFYSNTWRYGVPVCTRGDSCVGSECILYGFDSKENVIKGYPVKEGTVEQCTGISAWDGDTIYEGDTIVCTQNVDGALTEIEGKVVWSFTIPGFQLVDREGKALEIPYTEEDVPCTLGALYDRDYTFEII